MNRCARLSGIVPAFALLALALAAGPASADPKAWVDPVEIDLGVIEEGKLFERYVDVKNVGDGLLVLEDLKTSCGCTAAAVDGAVDLTAGKTQRVRLTFNTKGMDGPVHKTVTLQTNDPVQPQHQVVIRGDVHRAVRVTPRYLELRDVPMAGPWEQTVKLESDAPLNLKVTEAFILGGRLRDEPSQMFEVREVGTKREGDRDVREYAVHLRAPAKPQKLSEVLTFVTDQPAPNDTVKVAIRGDVVGRIKASSGFIVIRGVEVGETGRQDVTLSCTEGSFRVLGAEVPDSEVTATVHEGEGHQQAVVRLEYTGKEAGSNGVRTLVVRTDDAEQPQIEIPVRFSTRPAPGTAAANTPSPTSVQPAQAPAGKKTGK